MGSSILEPELAARFPEIRTFVAQGIDDPTATARLSLTSLGFHAMVLSTAGTVFVDPYRRWDARYVLSYFKADARKAAGADFHCDVKEESPGEEDPRRGPAAGLPPAAASGTQLRTYRLALAATGEYSTAVCAPNPAAVACALNAMVVSMNRVDGVYEREVAIRMVLIANDNLIVYTNGATDPYTNGNGTTMLGREPEQPQQRHRLGQLRHRPRLLDRRRRRRRARRAVHEQQGAGRHRPAQPDRRRLRHRLRGPRDGPPVRRQPHLQRHHRQLRQRQPQRRVGLRAGQRHHDHGLRRHLRRRGSPAAQRRHLPLPELRSDRGVLDRHTGELLRGHHRHRQPARPPSTPAAPSPSRSRRRSP